MNPRVRTRSRQPACFGAQDGVSGFRAWILGLGRVQSWVQGLSGFLSGAPDFEA